MYFPSNVEKYRSEVFEKLRPLIVNDRALRALPVLENFFYYPFTAFKKSFHHHFIYQELTAFQDKLERSRPDILQVWMDFIAHLDGTYLSKPGGEIVKFDSSLLKSRMEGKIPKYQLQWFNAWNLQKQEDLDDVSKIAVCSFGKQLAFSKEKLLNVLRKFHPSYLLLAREENTGKIIGYGWYYTEGDTVHFAEIARLPEYAGLNIGTSILLKLIKEQKTNQKIHISIPRSNPFVQRLYECGFDPIQQLPKFYEKELGEDGLLMQLNWDRYHKSLSRYGSSA